MKNFLSTIFSIISILLFSGFILLLWHNQKWEDDRNIAIFIIIFSAIFLGYSIILIRKFINNDKYIFWSLISLLPVSLVSGGIYLIVKYELFRAETIPSVIGFTAATTALIGVGITQYVQYQLMHANIEATKENTQKNLEHQQEILKHQQESLAKQLQTQIELSQKQFDHSFAIEQDKEMRDSKKESLLSLNEINQALRDLIDTDINLVNSGIGKYYSDKTGNQSLKSYFEGLIKKDEQVSITLKENVERALRILSTNRVIYDFCKQEELNRLIVLTDTYQKKSIELQTETFLESIEKLKGKKLNQNTLHATMTEYETLRDSIKDEIVISNAKLFNLLEEKIKNSPFKRQLPPQQAP